MTISRSCSLQKWAANNHRVSWQGLHPHSQTSLHAAMVNVRIDRLSRPGVELPPAQHAVVRRRQQAKAGGRRAPELFVRWLRALECLDAAVLVVVGELAVAGVPHDQVRGARARHAGWQPQAASRAGGLGRASLRLVDPGVVLCQRRTLSGRQPGTGMGRREAPVYVLVARKIEVDAEFVEQVLQAGECNAGRDAALPQHFGLCLVAGVVRAVEHFMTDRDDPRHPCALLRHGGRGEIGPQPGQLLLQRCELRRRYARQDV